MSFSGKFFARSFRLPVVGSFIRFFLELPRCTFDQRISAKDDKCAGRETRGASEKSVKSHRPKVEEIEENMDGETNLSIRGACR